MARMPGRDVMRQWQKELEKVRDWIEPRFARPEVRARAVSYLKGLVASVERKNGWQLAEFAGELSPTNIQHFIGRASWSADEVRDDLRRYVDLHLGEAKGVLIVDETGFLKKGNKSAGVARQYSGTAGRIENCQIGVFLAYRSSKGHALIDRELYLPKVWTEDAIRREEADIPDDRPFATKPSLARLMLQRAFDAGLPTSWVTADEIYGNDAKFRLMLQNKRVGYVLAVSCSQRVFIAARYGRADQLSANFPDESWQRISCGAGTKGERLYEWAFAPFTFLTDHGMMRGLLVRRSIKDPADRAYYLVHAKPETLLKELVAVAGSRWAIEECFEQAKQNTGLDEYEVRSWHAWYRHITLSMLAHAMLVAVKASLRSPIPKKRGGSISYRSPCLR